MGKIFKRGLIAVAPIALTLAIIIWLFGAMEKVFRIPLEWLIGEKYYFPGFGILVAFIVIFCVGAALNVYIVQKLTDWSDRVLMRIPFFKTFYNSVWDMMNYFKPKEKEEGRVVVLEFDGVKVLGLITREDFENLPKGLAKEDEVTVFIPLSYQIGGITLLVPRSKVRPIDMTVEQGMRFMLTAGVLSQRGQPQKK
ncbi:MAG: DUF502 domain-containing protein [Chlamydiae bacterium]|nr:DUF502 domain-containing protein [Chlamydiota bacterium]